MVGVEGIEPSGAWFRARLGCQQLTPHWRLLLAALLLALRHRITPLGFYAAQGGV